MLKNLSDGFLILACFIFMPFLFPISAYAFDIPTSLSASDRKEVVRTIGMNSATKALTNPYPLGGYSGLEVGYSLEFVNVRDVRSLGCNPTCPGSARAEDAEWRYSRLTVGKGLYNDVDMFLSIVAPIGSVRVSDYGAILRWAFYQAKFLPIHMSLLVSGNRMNYADTFVNQNLSAELLAGVNVDNFALYFGTGVIRSEGQFIGATTPCESCTVDPNDPAINHNTRTVSETVQEMHTMIGFSLHHGNLFAAAQVDRYQDAVYSMKVGLRY